VSAPPAVGMLRERVAFTRRQTVREPGGGHALSFSPVATLWARVTGLSVREGQRADARAATATHSVVLRFRDDVLPGDRLRWRERVLEVVGVEDLDGRRAFLACRCVEQAVLG
jgi:SPP1 family predicted phage head-tail adaptor